MRAARSKPDAANSDDLARYTEKRDRFIDLAQRELGG